VAAPGRGLVDTKIEWKNFLKLAFSHRTVSGGIWRMCVEKTFIFTGEKTELAVNSR
jgi:hypothetical protein